jgi:Family of unknown function (DUF5677)
MKAPIFKDVIKKSLSDAKEARAALTKSEGLIVGAIPNADVSHYLSNYALCLLNRQIDIFDDSILLLENNRIPSACIVSRGMIETHAFASYLADSVSKKLSEKKGKESVEQCLDIVLRFTNSSRYKETEQKKLAKGTFKLDDYAFTEQAASRMESSLASSEHVMNALRALYKEEVEHTKAEESQFEIVYDALSEWVHPSQTSIFHNYVPATHLIPTSQGEVHLHEAAILQCIRALLFITDSKNVYEWLLELANEISTRHLAHD